MAPEFRRVAIIGAGLIGGSIDLAITARAPSVDRVVLDRGDDLGAIRGCDLVVLAAPVLEIIRILPLLRSYLSPETLITDTGSTKSAIVAAAAGMRFVGGHPVAGAAAAGRAAARADLFAGRPWLLTPTAATPREDVSRLRTFVEQLGAWTHLLDAVEHDRLFALISHLPQLVVSTLMDVVGSGAREGGLVFAGAGLRDSTRLAGAPPDIWHDVVSTNRANVGSAIDALIGALATLRDDTSGEVLQRTFENAARWKKVLGDPPI